MTEYRGTFYIDGEYKKGIYYSNEKSFEENESIKEEDFYLPKPINAHTHIGDSFIKDEPLGSLAEVVGPGGFKIKNLKNASSSKIIAGMKNTISFMKRIGTGSFFDYREAGSKSIETLKAIREAEPNAITLGRPESNEDLEEIKDIIQGVGFSAVSDDDNDVIISIGKEARKMGLIVSIHFSENRQEPIEPLYDLKPDLLIHCTALNRDQLTSLKEITENIAITPRSNYFFNIRPDYSSFVESGFNIMLGTDNVMTVNPDIFQEMDFLYRIQKNTNRISHEEIMKMAFVNPYKFIDKMGMKIEKRWLKFSGKIPTPYQIVTKLHLMNPVETTEIEL
jgi:cytosine/adenosine deaminase-related metal-dependent hydrolase